MFKLKVVPSAKQRILRVPLKEASELINQRIHDGEIIYGSITTQRVGQLTGALQKFRIWDSYNLSLLDTIFTTTSLEEEYRTIAPDIQENPRRQTIRSLALSIRLWFERKRTNLQSIADRLELYEKVPELSLSNVEAMKSFGSKVFIVHGHDEAPKQTVARFLEKLGVTTVILHETPDKGKTIIEKLETNSSRVDIGYAVIILTPDDVGAIKSNRKMLKPRARQNVIFELGYFIAKLGRGRVRVLHKERVELPSDYQGVLYTPLDKAGAWKLELAREIQAAGINIDLNKLRSSL